MDSLKAQDAGSQSEQSWKKTQSAFSSGDYVQAADSLESIIKLSGLRRCGVTNRSCRPRLLNSPVEITQWIGENIDKLREQLVLACRFKCLTDLMSVGHLANADILRESILQAKLRVFQRFLPSDTSLEELKSLRGQAASKRPLLGESIYDFLDKRIKQLEMKGSRPSQQIESERTSTKSELPEPPHLKGGNIAETPHELPPELEI